MRVLPTKLSRSEADIDPASPRGHRPAVIAAIGALLIPAHMASAQDVQWTVYDLGALSDGEISVGEWYTPVLKIAALIGGTYGVAWGLVASIGVYTLQALSLAYVAASLAFLIGAFWMISGELRETLLRLPRVFCASRGAIL